eukprot:GILK01006175.1.p1 GENE.GILK01006175.1~~GILK01006175.1.p1  ORF type:complete len:268 (-),score=53.97 GILK01006175.1:212-1015(-)
MKRHHQPKGGIIITRPDEKRSKGNVQWDEETIALHDQERGTRMKIDEPKTPYQDYESEESLSGGEDAMHAGHVRFSAQQPIHNDSERPQKRIHVRREKTPTNTNPAFAEEVARKLNSWGGSDTEMTDSSPLPTMASPATVPPSSSNGLHGFEYTTTTSATTTASTTYEPQGMQTQDEHEQGERGEGGEEEDGPMQTDACDNRDYEAFEAFPPQDDEEKEPDPMFVAKRKAHYNEYLMAQALRRGAAEVDDEDDEDVNMESSTTTTVS